jgi:hypothetical protein
MEIEQKLQIVRLIDEAYAKVIARLNSISSTSDSSTVSAFIDDLKVKRVNSTGRILLNNNLLSQVDLNWVEYVLDSVFRQYYDIRYSLSQDASFHQYFKEFQDETTILKLQLTR